MILFKPNVRLKRFTPAIRFILISLDDLNARELEDYPTDFVVTSINDSKHKDNSKHYIDLAVDVRSKNFASEFIKKMFVQDMQNRLGSRFYVVYENAGTENEHFHIQVKKGQTFP